MKLVSCLWCFLAAPLWAEVKEESVRYADADFRVVRLEPSLVQVAWKDAQGEPYRTFDKVQAAYAKQGKTVKFLMNAGIFEAGGIPSGLHVEGGKQLHPLNIAAGQGNFFLKPNGVFLIRKAFGGKDVEQAYIHETGTFANWEKPMPAVRLGIQSGPLLLDQGKRHPTFKEGSPNKKHRNGVGIDGEGRVVFAMTAKDQEVNFWDFAGLFLKLGCKDALFLDGDISQMAVNPDKPVGSNRFAAMLMVAE
ncbi:phosphodiester glycosidase family protein [Haloferula sp. BvORR071]|uniref:phosphodiester glycosidase family protein n=1 Tax=Haloferula sp. BvORR071 TaxID=1396141 RepID=UPI000695D391|nr:phosphodiester glycosidase family protein [Haloferula sp. BvORR071]